MSESAIHHWWPKGLQSYWVNGENKISWVKPDGQNISKNPARNKTGSKRFGHVYLKGSPFQYNFEPIFDGVDRDVHNIIDTIDGTRPFGCNFRDIASEVGLWWLREHRLSYRCRYYTLDDAFHRDLISYIFGLLIRSPGYRDRRRIEPTAYGLPACDDIAKINMQRAMEVALEYSKSCDLTNHQFIFMRPRWGEFVFGDGFFDSVTKTLERRSLSGRAIVPLTPKLCVYFRVFRALSAVPNAASLCVDPYIVDHINYLTQIYSKDHLYFRNKKPDLEGPFIRGEYRHHDEAKDECIRRLDEITEAWDWRMRWEYSLPMVKFGE